ncbi:MAG TPA: hypothetical protein VML55_12855 [Planctomycetaceae bacterium]|nr:hypothetical protein [Planctomycetaceae bacterium]
MPRNTPFSPYRRAGAWFVVLAVGTYVCALSLPAVAIREAAEPWLRSHRIAISDLRSLASVKSAPRAPGWAACRAAFLGTLTAVNRFPRGPFALGAAVNVAFILAFLGGMVWFGRRACQTAAAVCLIAAITARLIPVLYHPQRWAAPGLLAGYWLWIAAMLLAAIGFWMLATWFRAGPMPEEELLS